MNERVTAQLFCQLFEDSRAIEHPVVTNRHQCSFALLLLHSARLPLPSEVPPFTRKYGMKSFGTRLLRQPPSTNNKDLDIHRSIAGTRPRPEDRSSLPSESLRNSRFGSDSPQSQVALLLTHARLHSEEQLRRKQMPEAGKDIRVFSQTHTD